VGDVQHQSAFPRRRRQGYDEQGREIPAAARSAGEIA